MLALLPQSLTMEIEAKRNRTWEINVSNRNKDSQEVGVTLTVEA